MLNVCNSEYKTIININIHKDIHYYSYSKL